MSVPTVTALYASINALFTILLAARIPAIRRRDKVSLGTGDSKELLLAVRVHGNNIETVPLTLLLLLLAELCGGASLWLHVAGATLVVTRVMHAVGLPRPAPNVFRVAGTAGGWLVIVSLAAWLLLLRRG
jgi:uncharacterized membrane protein YecN with MAPEG domain